MNRELMAAIAWGGGTIALALGATAARKLGYIDAETVTRLVIGSNGLMIAWYGNRMPKALAPSACARQIARVAGWSMFLSGIVYTGLWVFAPVQVAIAVGCGVVATGMAVTLGYCLSLRSRMKVA